MTEQVGFDAWNIRSAVNVALWVQDAPGLAKLPSKAEKVF